MDSQTGTYIPRKKTEDGWRPVDVETIACDFFGLGTLKEVVRERGLVCLPHSANECPWHHKDVLPLTQRAFEIYGEKIRNPKDPSFDEELEKMLDTIVSMALKKGFLKSTLIEPMRSTGIR